MLSGATIYVYIRSNEDWVLKKAATEESQKSQKNW